MKFGGKKLHHRFLLIAGMLCLGGLSATPSGARILESTNGPRVTVGAAGHAYTKEELAKRSSEKNARKVESKKHKKAAASGSG
ncbi:hypothetical protein, partial [Methylacidimicrobium cyclopophantes]|uniref:hypothetical protein n=1 Tax=Methylacidimicrobium cyclopophantes TaxID=1041766 RepID=UPI001159B5BC